MSAFTRWLDTRDSEELSQVWPALDAKRVEVADPDWGMTMRGVMQLASAFLDWPLERIAWLERGPAGFPEPTFRREREARRCFVETGIDLRDEPCFEAWMIHEDVEGDRGLQHVEIYYRQSDGTPDGTGDGRTAVRLFDRATKRGVTIDLRSRAIYVIGEVDITAMDHFVYYGHFAGKWRSYDSDGLRGVIAQLAADLDAHFDDCATWPRVDHRSTVTPMSDPAAPGHRYTMQRFASGDRTIEVTESLHTTGDGSLTAHATGLPPGDLVYVSIGNDRRAGTFRLSTSFARGKLLVERARRLLLE